MGELRTILLAEDNPKDVELTLEALAEHNLANHVIVVRDGVEAMEYLQCQGKHKLRKPELPAVLLLDIKMPRMDGIEVLRAVRNDPGLKILPVVMLTSSREEQDFDKKLRVRSQRLCGQAGRFQRFYPGSERDRRLLGYH